MFKHPSETNEQYQKERSGSRTRRSSRESLQKTLPLKPTMPHHTYFNSNSLKKLIIFFNDWDSPDLWHLVDWGRDAIDDEGGQLMEVGSSAIVWRALVHQGILQLLHYHGAAAANLRKTRHHITHKISWLGNSHKCNRESDAIVKLCPRNIYIF